MALIGNLAVALTAQTGAFASKLKGASKSVQGFASSVTGALTGTTAKFLGLAAAITGVGSVAAFAHLTKGAMESIDTTAKLADRLSVTTEGLIGLQHAADLAGSSGEVLGSALDKLQKNIGNGGSAVEAALASIGLSRDKLLGKGAVNQFKMIADGVNTLATSEQRASVITALFGKTGQELTATLALGSAGLNQATDEAVKLGLAFSRVDGYKVEEANDAISKMNDLLTGGFRQVGIAISPVLAALADKITSLVTDAGGIGPMMAAGFDALVPVLNSVVELLGKAAAGFILIAANALDFSAKVRELFPFLTSVVDTAMGKSGAAGDGYSTEDINAATRDRAERLRSSADGVRAATAGDAFTKALSPIMQAAQDRADAANLKAMDFQAGQLGGKMLFDQYGSTVFNALKMGADYFAAAFEGAGQQALGESAIDKAYQNVFDQQRAAALDPRVGLFNEAFMGKISANSAIESASAGTRGTFASDTAGRSVAAFSIEKEQLEVQKDIVKEIEKLNTNIVNGAPVG